MNFAPYHLFGDIWPRAFSFEQMRCNTRSQATIRREIRQRSNLPKAVQRRLGFKCK